MLPLPPREVRWRGVQLAVAHPQLAAGGADAVAQERQVGLVELGEAGVRRAGQVDLRRQAVVARHRAHDVLVA